GMARIEIPIVGAVHGLVLGGGCELAVMCDMLLASEDVKIGQPEIRVGVFPPIAAAAFPRRMPWAAAADLVLTGRTVRGEEALRMGLVSRLIPAGDFTAEVEKAVQEIASLSRPVLRASKRALLAGAQASLGALEAVEKIYIEELMQTEDAHEGLNAFLEKRAPIWKDR
ncbi:MAG: enoyl-CoA hydratase/isomerase family protein, partial [Planctomycetota bacterium]